MLAYTDEEIAREELYLNNPPRPLVERIRDILPLILRHLNPRQAFRMAMGHKRSERDALARCMRVNRVFRELAGEILYYHLEVERKDTTWRGATDFLYIPQPLTLSVLDSPLRHTRYLVLNHDADEPVPSQTTDPSSTQYHLSMPKLCVARISINLQPGECLSSLSNWYLSLAPGLSKVIAAGHWPATFASFLSLPESTHATVRELVLVVRIDKAAGVDPRRRIIFTGKEDLLERFPAVSGLKLVLLPILIPMFDYLPIAEDVTELLTSLRKTIAGSSRVVTIEIVGMEAAMNPCSYGHQGDKRAHDVRSSRFDYEAYRKSVEDSSLAGKNERDQEGKEKEEVTGGVDVRFVTIGEYLGGEVWREELTDVERSVLSFVASRHCKSELGKTCLPQCNHAARHS